MEGGPYESLARRIEPNPDQPSGGYRRLGAVRVGRSKRCKSPLRSFAGSVAVPADAFVVAAGRVSAAVTGVNAGSRASAARSYCQVLQAQLRFLFHEPSVAKRPGLSHLNVPILVARLRA